MLSGIGDFLTNIWESISQIIDFLISTIKDIIYFIGLVKNVPVYLGGALAWLPLAISSVIVVLLTLVIVLRITKYLGD